MQLFNNTKGPVVVPEGDYTIEFKDPSAESQSALWRSLVKIVSFPFQVATRLYNIYSERRGLIASNNPFQVASAVCLFYFTSPPRIETRNYQVAKALLHHPRNGDLFAPEPFAMALFRKLFSVGPERIETAMLKRLYPSRTITPDDSILSCHADLVKAYREPILDFIGPGNLKKNGPAIEKLIHETVTGLSRETDSLQIDAVDLSVGFSTKMISELLLGNVASFEMHKEIGYAASVLANGPRRCEDPRGVSPLRHDFSNNDAYLKEIKAFDKKAIEEGPKALETLRRAIEVSFNSPNPSPLGALVDTLRERGELTDLQIKSLILTLYVGGSETISSLLTCLLWGLAKDEKYQEELFQEVTGKEGSLIEIGTKSPLVNNLFTESIQLFSPVKNIYRVAATDLVCIAKDENQKEMPLKIERGTQITYELSWAAKRPQDDHTTYTPKTFNPRNVTPSDKKLPWLPFGSGSHTCPGRWLAKTEILAFITLLVQEYKITALSDQQPQQNDGRISARVDEKVPILLTKRSRHH